MDQAIEAYPKDLGTIERQMGILQSMVSHL